MLKKILLLSIATFIVVLFFYYAGITNNKNDFPQVRGVSTKAVLLDESPQDDISILLTKIAKSYNIEKIEFFNTSFKWLKNDKVYDLLGLGLIIDQNNLSLWPIKNAFIQNSLIQTDYPYGETEAYINEDVICVLKSNLNNNNSTFDSVEIRCGYTDGIK